ncbi:hypothetical protein Pcinc_021767 [Petrolisthes cinctipes]|uniref:Uncharacterized protein n=1 Tax=Petrolisthes cinctipes TaxID=88211 RepID=A0AAE1FJ78_PETCI|nr:hypothetical protein Pcinc_021767 [Petrolisthes cinctipes]
MLGAASDWGSSTHHTARPPHTCPHSLPAPAPVPGPTLPARLTPAHTPCPCPCPCPTLPTRLTPAHTPSLPLPHTDSPPHTCPQSLPLFVFHTDNFLAITSITTALTTPLHLLHHARPYTRHNLFAYAHISTNIPYRGTHAIANHQPAHDTR